MSDRRGLIVARVSPRLRFIYDLNLILEERDTNNAATITLMRGLDLSGSFQGAGGIGGILAMTETFSSNARSSFYHADGNGNVRALVGTNQILVAQYDYDPFGNTLSIAGANAFVNRYRFSSKPYHEVIGMYDFRFRWYSPELQRWINRDPIGEVGGFNLFAYVSEDPVGAIDPFGQCPTWGEVEAARIAAKKALQEVSVLEWQRANALEVYRKTPFTPEVRGSLMNMNYAIRRFPALQQYTQATKALPAAIAAYQLALKNYITLNAALAAGSRALPLLGKGGAVGAAGAVGAFTGYYIRNEVNYGIETAGLLFWNTVYGIPCTTGVASGPERY